MNPDDPKFTAHALGEVEDLTAAERAEIEALLASDPGALAEAEEVRALAARLRAEMPGEEAGALHEEQRAAVFSAAATKAASAKIVRFPLQRLAQIAAVLAVIGLAGLITFLAAPAGKERTARAQEPQPAAPFAEEPTANLGGLIASNPAPAPDFAPAPASAAAPAAPAMPIPSGQLGVQASAAAPTAVTTAPAAPAAPAASADPAADRPANGPVLLGQVTVTDPQAATALHGAAGTQRAPVKAPVTVTPITDARSKAAAIGSLAMNKDVAEKTAKFSKAMAKDASSATSMPISEPFAVSPAAPMTRTFSGSTGGALASKSARPYAHLNELRPSPVASVPAPVPTASPVGYDGQVRRIQPADGRPDQPVNNPDPQSAEVFDELADNAFLTAREQPLSTFSIDVDTASYAIVRRFLNNQQQPPKGAVRIEELLNYFTYDYAPPQGDTPFSAAIEVSACPWAPEHRLVRIGLKGREIARDKRPPSNLVFLIDVSGSMEPENKLPLLKESLALLINQLGPEDQVAIVVYAGSSGCVLEPTHDKRKMHAALRKLEAGGSTNGGSGVQLAYKLAEQSFIKGGTNRVILATDGDWNVGITRQSDLLRLIKDKAKSGVFLTVLGVGMDNLQDTMLVKLADTGNGNYAYLDTLTEAKKVLVDQLSGTLVTIAKDVKIQVEFNPAQVGSYRLIGYEKRMLAKEDFNNDKKDAGEIGAGHTVTALYEVVPAGQELLALQKVVDPLKYQPAPTLAPMTPVAPAFNDSSAPSALSNVPGSQPKIAPTNARLSVSQGGLKLEPENEIVPASPSAEAPTAPSSHKKVVVETDHPAPPSPEAAAAPRATREAAAEPYPAKPSPVADKAKAAAPAAVRNELLTLKLRYKDPEAETSKLLEFPLIDRGTPWEQSSRDFRFAAAVAGYGMLLRDSSYKGEATWSAVSEWAHEGKGTDASGYRAEFLRLLEKARAVSR